MTIAGGLGCHRARSRCYESLVKLSEASGDPRELVEQAGERLRRTIGFEQWCWMTADPVSGLCTSHLASPSSPLRATLPDLVARMSEGGEPIGVAGAPRREGCAGSIGLLTGGDLERSELWRECLAPCGVGDGLSLSCVDQTGVWGHLNAQRCEHDRHFAESDLFLLEDASPSIARLMRRSVIDAPSSHRPGVRAPAPAVVILGPELEVRGRTAGVADWLALFPDAPLAQRWGQLPAAVYAVVGRLRGAGESVARVRTGDGHWASLQAARIEQDGEGDLAAVTIRPASAGELFEILSRAHELSSRESMLARHVVNGLGTSEIAERLSIVPYTVKDHLKSIFRKTGVSSRGELASRLTGRI